MSLSRSRTIESFDTVEKTVFAVDALPSMETAQLHAGDIAFHMSLKHNNGTPLQESGCQNHE